MCADKFQTAAVARSERGFTLYELMITVAILALVLGLGVPSMQTAVEKRQTVAAAEHIYSQLQLARSASVARSEQVFANIVEGVDWAVGVSNNAACDPSDNSPACTLPDVDGGNAVTQLVTADDFDTVTLATTSAQITFSPQRATASAATIDITSTEDIGFRMRVEVGLLGQISMCSPNAVPATYVTGYRAC